ncbi:MAG: hypothetical protein ABSC22_20710 [Roseiarcus sp.]|jgi:hypothetical protein
MSRIKTDPARPFSKLRHRALRLLRRNLPPAAMPCGRYAHLQLRMREQRSQQGETLRIGVDGVEDAPSLLHQPIAPADMRRRIDLSGQGRDLGKFAIHPPSSVVRATFGYDFMFPLCSL